MTETAIRRTIAFSNILEGMTAAKLDKEDEKSANKHLIHSEYYLKSEKFATRRKINLGLETVE